jgi:hypothetical protein
MLQSDSKPKKPNSMLQGSRIMDNSNTQSVDSMKDLGTAFLISDLVEAPKPLFNG